MLSGGLLGKIWGVGAGLSYRLTGDRTLDLNATFLDVGDAPVDTANQGADQGRIVGENDDPYAVLFELTYHHFRRLRSITYRVALGPQQGFQSMFVHVNVIPVWKRNSRSL